MGIVHCSWFSSKFLTTSFCKWHFKHIHCPASTHKWESSHQSLSCLAPSYIWHDSEFTMNTHKRAHTQTNDAHTHKQHTCTTAHTHKHQTTHTRTLPRRLWDSVVRHPVAVDSLDYTEQGETMNHQEVRKQNSNEGMYDWGGCPRRGCLSLL